MKILLVRPPVPKHTIGLKNIMICEPLELEYIAALLGGHQLQIIDLLVENGFEKKLKKFNPDVIISSAYKAGTNEVIKLFRKAKTLNPNIITITGGVHATLNPIDFADVSVDIIGIGDGTFLIKEVIDTIENQTSLWQVDGLAFPVSSSELAFTAKRKYMPNADTLPFPDRNLVSHLKEKYYYLMHKPVATLKTTWGCWYKCNFCFTYKITDSLTYSRSPESIVEELKTISAKEIYIVDDIFLINKSRLRKLADLIKENNINKNYLVYSRADFIAENEDVIAEWASLGLKSVFVGLEAALDSELDLMNKECDVQSNIDAIKILQKHNVDIYGSLIPGADYSLRDWERLWEFIKQNQLYYVNISPMTPLPGSDNFNHEKQFLTVPEDAHSLFDLSHVLLPTKLPLKTYYRQLLKIYVRTVLNVSRANKITKRSLPTIWSVNYLKMMYGSIKIGFQFWNAHKHHTPKEIINAQYKGEFPINYSFETKFSYPFFKK